MIVQLYKNTSDPNVVNKSIELLETHNGSLKEDSSILTPTILFRGVSMSNIPNYAYIDQFKRYYFIDDITIVSANQFSVSMRCDVLMSHRAQILNCTGIIARQENLYNLYQTDGAIGLYADQVVQNKRFPQQFGIEPQFIMVTTGQAPSVTPEVQNEEPEAETEKET